MRKNRLHLSGLIFQRSIFSAAWAQQAPSTADTSSASSEGQLTEMMVMAQRREENAQHGAVAIDVLSADTSNTYAIASALGITAAAALWRVRRR